MIPLQFWKSLCVRITMGGPFCKHPSFPVAVRQACVLESNDSQLLGNAA